MEKWMLPAAALATRLCLILSASIATAPGNAAAQAAVPAGALSQPLDLGTLAEPAEMLYVPVTPCRVVDTRLSHGALTDGENRSYHVAGTAGIAEQGGKADGCGIPAGATSITAILSAVSPAGSGYMQVWAAGSEKPNATLLLYGTSTTGSGANTPMRSGADTNLSVENHGGPSDLIIDVTGYYAPQMFAAISGGAGTHTSRLLSATLESQGLSPDGHPLWGPTRLQWDRDVTNCLTEVDFGADTPNRKQITTNGAYTEVTAWRGELPSAYNFTVTPRRGMLRHEKCDGTGQQDPAGPSAATGSAGSENPRLRAGKVPTTRSAQRPGNDHFDGRRVRLGRRSSPSPCPTPIDWDSQSTPGRKSTTHATA